MKLLLSHIFGSTKPKLTTCNFFPFEMVFAPKSLPGVRQALFLTLVRSPHRFIWHLPYLSLLVDQTGLHDQGLEIGYIIFVATAIRDKMARRSICRLQIPSIV